MSELENQIAIQNENLNKISTLANKKQEKLNNDISEYVQQINDLKNEMEVLNNIITNLTEEKENNTIKISNLIKENEKLRTEEQEPDPAENKKKYEETILKLKKNIVNLREEKKELEELIIKQEVKVNDLTNKVGEVENLLTKKDNELKDSLEYTAKLAININTQKKEIQKLKQSQNNINNNKNTNESISILNLQKMIQNMCKDLENKDNKINLLSTNNKILQGKINKLSQTMKNGFNNNFQNNNNTDYTQNNNNAQSQNIPLINLNTKQKQQINKNNNCENNKEIKHGNTKNLNNVKKNNIHQQSADKKKLFILAKPTNKSKTPGKLNNNQLLRNDYCVYNKNDNDDLITTNTNKKNINNNNKNIYPILKGSKNANIKNSLNDLHKKENAKNKEESLFDENLSGINIKDETLELFNKNAKNLDNTEIEEAVKNENLNLKTNSNINKNENDPSVINSYDGDFPVIESYCVLNGKDK